MSHIPRALTIAGSDPGGGAGIQADLKTFTVFRVYGSTVITSLTAQNTIEVTDIYPLPPEFVGSQIDAVLSDIGTDSVKTGMLYDKDIIEMVADKLDEYSLKAVVDPVMVTKRGDLLLKQDAVDMYRKRMMKMALITTPNIREAEVLTSTDIRSVDDMISAAEDLHATGADYVVIKGKTLGDKVVDVFYDGTDSKVIEGDKFSGNKHGSGCTFSAAITAMLAKGSAVEHAVQTAKKFIEDAIQKGTAVGSGEHPVDHCVWCKEKDF